MRSPVFLMVSWCCSVSKPPTHPPTTRPQTNPTKQAPSKAKPCNPGYSLVRPSPISRDTRPLRREISASTTTASGMRMAAPDQHARPTSPFRGAHSSRCYTFGSLSGPIPSSASRRGKRGCGLPCELRCILDRGSLSSVPAVITRLFDDSVR